MNSNAMKKATVKKTLAKFFKDHHLPKPKVTFNDGCAVDISLSFAGCDDTIELMRDMDGRWELFFNSNMATCVTVDMPMKLEALYKIHAAMAAICSALADSTTDGLDAILNAAVA